MLVFKRKIKKLLHLWNGRSCPICGARFDAYEETGTTAIVWEELYGVGAGKRKAICPHCGSSDRERLVFLYFRDYYLPSHKGEKLKMFHVAPETNLSDFLRSQAGMEYVAGDKRCEGYSYPDYVQDVDIMDMSEVTDDTFDIIVCNHVLEHVPDDVVAMKELRRVLKPEGIAVLQVPYAMKLERTFEDKSIIAPEERFRAYGQSDHVRLYGMDYPDRLKRAGFKVEALDIAGKYPKKFGLNSKELLFVCHK